MRKTILLLMLCVPLVLAAWHEGQRLHEARAWTAPKADAQEVQPSPTAADLDKIKAAADAIITLPEGLAAAVLRLDPPPKESENLAMEEPARGFVKAVLDHADVRARGQHLVEKARLDAAEMGGSIRQVLEQIRDESGLPRYKREDLDRLTQLLTAYEKLRVYAPELLASAQAEGDWAELESKHPRRQLDDFYDQLDRWLPAAPPASASLPDAAEATAQAETYRRYIEKHHLVKEAHAVNLMPQARERLTLWERGAKLAGVLRRDPDRRIEQIDEVAKLAEDHPPVQLEATVRRLIQTLCNDLLKPEPYDDEVLLISDEQSEPERVSRHQITINRKDRKLVKLDDSGQDEYTLRREDVENFLLPMGSIRNLPRDQTVAPLRGTEYSEAIRAFNVQRAQINQWSESELTKLRQTCVKHQTALAQGGAKSGGGATLISRIDSLLPLVRKYTNLFIAFTP